MQKYAHACFTPIPAQSHPLIGVFINVTSFSSISYYSNSGINLKKVIRTKTPVLYFYWV